MYTQCPDCASVYAISTEELGAASGMVRCSLCNGTFNALRRLSPDAPKEPYDDAKPQQPELNFDTPDDKAIDISAETPQATSPEPPSETLQEAVPEASLEVLTETDLDAPVETSAILPISQSEQNMITEAINELAASTEDETDVDLEYTSDSIENDPALAESSYDDATGEDSTEVNKTKAHTDTQDPQSTDADNEEQSDPQADLALVTLNKTNVANNDSLDDDELMDIYFEEAIFSSSVELEAWDTLEGEHDLEELLADEALLESEILEDDILEDNNDDDASLATEHADILDDAISEHADNDGEPSATEADTHSSSMSASDNAENLQFAHQIADEEEPPAIESEPVDESQADESTEPEQTSTASEDQENDQPTAPTTSDPLKKLEPEPLVTKGENSEHEVAVDEIDDQVGDEGSQVDAENDTSIESSIEPPEAEETPPNDQVIEDVDESPESQAHDDHDYRDLSHYLKPKKSWVRRIAEGLAAAGLVLLMVAQYVHHHRATLATHEHYGPWLRETYSKLGLGLQVKWNLEDYRIARHTVIPGTNQKNILLARATVINNAPSDRPLPLIKLELRNRWGDAIFASVFEPAQYLQTDIPNWIQAGGRVEVALDVVNPTDEDDIGYSFDVCLNTQSGLNCGQTNAFGKQ